MKILSIAYALPSKKVTNEDLIEEILERNRGRMAESERESLRARLNRFFAMSGSQTRFHRDNGERAIDLALRAGNEALEKAGVSREDVDLLIYAGVGRGWVEPATANLFQSELKLRSATCFDVLDACASWIRSLAIAKTFLAQKVHKLIMILNCECNFREYANFDIANAQDLENSFSAFTIGEAATATLVTSREDEDDSFFSFKTWGEKHGLCKIALPNADDFSPSNGNGHTLKPMAFFTAPSELLSFTIRKLVSHYKESEALASRFYDLIVGHAVSVSSTARAVALMSLDPSRVFDTHARFGNTVSASLPLGLAVAEQEGRLTRGMRVLLVMGSAGVTTAFASFQY
ncbi:MAG TPA: 3-oxoacyl-[acyl-carrier-protein] synthase III C-terminal domain-containing protein [Acidobacteriota bacterium]|nr:3-oxoacyl-[acyl-carrier-protein] synthase III C-terminal domain-containing protein [Acidobacteriota bacterium]